MVIHGMYRTYVSISHHTNGSNVITIFISFSLTTT